MVQSQSDPPSPSIRPDTTTFSSASSKRSKALIQNGDVDPYPLMMSEAGTNPSQVSEGRTHRKDPDGSGVYTPYRGFGKSRSKKSRVASESVGSLTGSGEDDDHPLSVPNLPEPLVMPVKFGTNKDIGQETPSRSATLMTASTLVAEDGYDTTDGMDDAVSKPFLKVNSHSLLVCYLHSQSSSRLRMGCIILQLLQLSLQVPSAPTHLSHSSFHRENPKHHRHRLVRGIDGHLACPTPLIFLRYGGHDLRLLPEHIYYVLILRHIQTTRIMTTTMIWVPIFMHRMHEDCSESVPQL